MISENEFETKNGMAVRVNAKILLDVNLCFSVDSGGDIELRQGDEVTIIVFDRQRNKTKPKTIKRK